MSTLKTIAVRLLFVAKGANVNAVDEDGDSSLHMALMRQNVYTTTSPELMDAVSLRVESLFVKVDRDCHVWCKI